jgi:stearoyl-CoA desaturase (Delta-9 desaturase)
MGGCYRVRRDSGHWLRRPNSSEVSLVQPIWKRVRRTTNQRYVAQPYSSKCSARDSWLLAIVTFGEGYHNYHHEFQHDYRNGVKPWQIDPTKWIIWILSRIGLISNLRRVPTEKIVLAELAEAKRQLEATLASPALTEANATYIANAYQTLLETAQQWTQCKAGQLEVTREMLANLRNEIRVATSALRMPGLRRRQPA